MEYHFELPGRKNRREGLIKFADQLTALTNKVGMKLSSRGWAYQLEGFRIINKNQLDMVENIINECRKKGYLPIDFVATEEARKFSGVEIPNSNSPVKNLKSWLTGTLNSAEYYTPDWWYGEKYYIQMLVEKIDIKNLFEPVCQEYHIPIATSKGWSSIIQRGEYAKRFKEAEEMGLKCVLLYCGDHDPDGLRISKFIKKNLMDIADVYWDDGTEGYDPYDLVVDRFGLNYDFIVKNDLTWIENLITGKKTLPNDLSDPKHPNHNMSYVQDYLRNVGAKKCEANALIVRKEEGRQLCRNAIEGYVGAGALDRFEAKRQLVRDEINAFFEKTGLDNTLKKGIKLIDKED